MDNSLQNIKILSKIELKIKYKDQYLNKLRKTWSSRVSR